MQLEANKGRGRSFRTGLWQGRGFQGNRIRFQNARAGMSGERMKSSVASPVIGADMRPTYVVNERNTRVNQLNEHRRAQEAAVRESWSGEGIRATFAYGVMIVLAVVFGLILLAGRYEVIRVEIQNSKILARVNETQRKCAVLQTQIEETESNLFVGYAAVDLGLVSDNGVEKMKLTAPTDAIVLPQSSHNASR